MPKGDREKLKADPEDGTTPISNLLLEAIAIAKLTGKEKGVLLYLCRRTYGWVKNGQRLKEAELPLRNWADVLQTDTSKASHILSGLVKKRVIKREFLGAGKGYIYSINTRVARWDKGCLKRQLLSQIGRQGLPKTARVVLPKTTTPPDTNLATGKERLNKVLKKETTTTFQEFKDQLRKRFSDLDFDAELEKFDLYWSEGGRTLRRPKLALKNWMDKAREIKSSKKISDDPNKFVKGKYGHVVQR